MENNNDTEPKQEKQSTTIQEDIDEVKKELGSHDKKAEDMLTNILTNL